jgi:hypothetical protein
MQGIFVQLSEFYYKHNDVDDGYIFTKIHQWRMESVGLVMKQVLMFAMSISPRYYLIITVYALIVHNTGICSV